MHTPASEQPTVHGESRGVGAAAREVAEHASTIARLEFELAQLELKRKLGAFGTGIGMLLGAAVFGLFTIGFLLATLAAALETFLPDWLSLLLVSVFLLVLVGVLGMLGLSTLRRGTPPVPTQAIEEAKLTTTALKGNGKR
jgi:hypothetical protein